MGCPATLIPQPALSWPGYPQLLLVGLGLNLVIYGINLVPYWRFTSQRQVTVLFLVSTPLILCGYYIMYGIAQPWQNAIEHEQWQELQVLSPSCSSIALQSTFTSAVETTQHLFLLGFLIFMAGMNVWSVARFVWTFRPARQTPAPASV